MEEIKPLAYSFNEPTHQAEPEELHGELKVHKGDVLSMLMLALILVLRSKAVAASDQNTTVQSGETVTPSTD